MNAGHGILPPVSAGKVGHIARKPSPATLAASEKRRRQPSSNTSMDAKAQVRATIAKNAIGQKPLWYEANAAAPAAAAPSQLETRRCRPTSPDKSRISANAPNTAVSTR